MKELALKTSSDSSLNVLTTDSEDMPTILFIHGFSFTSQVWNKQISDPRLTQNAYLIAPDLRGHGESSHKDDVAFYSSVNFADDIHALIDSLPIKKLFICAWSLGTRIINEYLQKYGAEKISGLVFVCGAPGTDPIRKKRLEFAQKLSNAKQHKGLFDEFAELLSPCSIKYKDDLKNNICKSFKTVPDFVRNSILSWEPLKGSNSINSLPTEIFIGEEDQIVNYKKSMSVYKKSYPHANIKTFKKSGHMPFWDKPDLFNDLLINFINKTIR